MKAFLYMTKSQNKNLIILRMKRAFMVVWKALFSLFLKGFQLSKLFSDLRVRLSMTLNNILLTMHLISDETANERNLWK